MPKRGAQAKKIKKYLWRYWWVKALVITIVVFGIIASVFVAFGAAYANKIFPGVSVGAFPVGGLTRAESEQALVASAESLRDKGLVFVYRGRTVSVPMVTTAPNDPDLSYELVAYAIPRTIDRAYAYGRSGSFLVRWYERVFALFSHVELVPDFSWRPDSVREIVRENMKTMESPAENAALVIRGTTVTVTDEHDGIAFQYDRALKEAQSQLIKMIFAPIPLSLEPETATIAKADAVFLLPDVTDLLTNKTPITITLDDITWTWNRETIAPLLEIRRNAETGSVMLGLSQEKLALALEPLRAKVDVAVQEPKFKRENDKVVEFKPSINGRAISLEKTVAAWELLYIDERATEVPLIMDEVSTSTDIADLNDLGIIELLGVGTSSFAGSPQNRRHNIKIGADAVNGTLVAPGEEFSLLKTLGAIDKTTGYLPELVIKGNKTVPEYGGGLCQIGTTTFRGTLAAGLPITARRNHSYSVSYYYDEYGLPGTDATIYDPAPDYRFLNNTEKHVLITTRIVDSELFFEFWGTKDGRIVEQSRTRVWDKVSPPPTKYIETLDLPVGEKKCTESPHAGIKAAFDYTITYPTGDVVTETFSSQYRPWQEVCLIGVDKLTEETLEDVIIDNQQASSTPVIIQ